MKKTIRISITVLLLASLLLTSCFRQKGQQDAVRKDPVTLTFYGLFENEEIYTPLIQAYESKNPHVTILYKKFTNPEEYLDLVINELAEGEGPDIFMLHNTLFPKHYKKLTPAPQDFITADLFRSLFVSIAGDEMIIPDEAGVERVWGLPLYIDTLALYYNDDHIEEALPSQGRPSSTWEGIKNDVVQLNRQDQSFERFERAGIALGRADNILRAFDILALMMLQYKVNFYTEDLKEVVLAQDPNALTALQLYTSFALPTQKHYSWNKVLADTESAEKELTTFARGKLSMLLGYSYAYADIVNEINRLKAEGEDAIDLESIKIQEAPQVYDPETSAETREAYASYFVPAVSRTSKHAEEAWDFLAEMVTEENLRYYNEKTHKPSALRSLIDEQMADPLYGAFAAQVGYAESFPMADAEAYQTAFLNAIEQVLDTVRIQNVLSELNTTLQSLIPANGIKPIYILEE
ncbi:MAG: extracellular solute-binding protein [Candidatus Gracilibacteria bacterium]|jgi:ABC-type glycerol-3-phosphate transport system substrate-binding protein